VQRPQPPVSVGAQWRFEPLTYRPPIKAWISLFHPQLFLDYCGTLRIMSFHGPGKLLPIADFCSIKYARIKYARAFAISFSYLQVLESMFVLSDTKRFHNHVNFENNSIPNFIYNYHQPAFKSWSGRCKTDSGSLLLPIVILQIVLSVKAIQHKRGVQNVLWVSAESQPSSTAVPASFC
jgi:hypothetical protein